MTASLPILGQQATKVMIGTNHSIWPTVQQENLLRAALLQGSSAIRAWQDWSPAFETTVDLSSYRLLPMVYRNLQNQDFPDPLMGRLKGIYRKSWVENQIILHLAGKVIQLMKAAEIPTLIIKGIALILLYYQDPGLRPMGDFDILVPTEKREEAIKTLLDADFRLDPLTPLRTAYLDTRHAVNFYSSQGGKVDLHWHLLANCLDSHADIAYWQDAVLVSAPPFSTLTLNPTDMLLHICYHGLHLGNAVTPLRWIPDALTILQVAQNEIQWPRLVEKVNQLHIGLILHAALDYLERKFQAPIPTNVLDALVKLPHAWPEYGEFQAITQHSHFFGDLPRLWHSYLRVNQYRPDPINFVKYLRNMHGFANYYELLQWTLSRCLLGLRGMLTGRGLKKTKAEHQARTK